MSAAISSPTTPSSIAEFFEVKATQSIEKWKVSHSDIKILLKKISNSSEGITLEDYHRVQKATSNLNFILATQNSKVIEKKALNIHKAYCKTFNKLSDVSIHYIKTNAQQNSTSLRVLELTTKDKVIKQKDIINLMKKNQNIKDRVNIFINELNKEVYWQPSESQYHQLRNNLLTLENNVDKCRNNLLSSSYQHNSSKFVVLTQLKSELAQLSNKLQNSYNTLKITNQSDNHSPSSEKCEDDNSNLNTHNQLNINKMSSIHKLELAQLKKIVPILESELEQLKSERQKNRSKLSKLQSERHIERNQQANNDDYVKNQGFQAAIKNENA